MCPDLPPGRYVVGVDLRPGEQVTIETMWIKRYCASMLFGSVQASNEDPVADIDVSTDAGR